MMNLPPRQVMREPDLCPYLYLPCRGEQHPQNSGKFEDAPTGVVIRRRETELSRTAGDGSPKPLTASSRRVQDDPSQEVLERLASSQAEDLEILLSKVRSQAESSGLKNAMDEEERRCTSRILTLSRGEDGLTLVTSGGKCSETINEQSPQPDGPNAVTPDPKATPSVWGTFEGMFSPVKQQVKKKVKDIQQKVEDKVNLLLAAQSQERGEEREKAQGEEGQGDDCKKGRIVVTADGHSYEGGLNELGAMHGYGVLRWSDGHCFQVLLTHNTHNTISSGKHSHAHTLSNTAARHYWMHCRSCCPLPHVAAKVPL